MRIQLNDEDSVQAVSRSPDIAFRVAGECVAFESTGRFFNGAFGQSVTMIGQPGPARAASGAGPGLPFIRKFCGAGFSLRRAL